jgi:hypothetical protein
MSGSAQRHPMIDRTVIADYGRFTDDRTHSVVNEKSGTDPGAGMNLNAGKKAAGL